MKYLKMIGLAAVAAAALMAFAGIASAETTLCKDKKGTECYGAGTEVKSSLESGTKAVLDPSGFFAETVECSESTVAGKVETATTASGKGTSLTFGGCNFPVATDNPGSISLHATSSGNGTLKTSGVEVTVEQSGLNCKFGGNVSLEFKGGEMATANASKVTVEGLSGFPCPSSSTWTAKYTVTSPEPAFAVSGV